MGHVEPHGLTAVAPLHTLRRAEPSEAYPPSPRLRRVPTSHSSTGLHPWPSAKEGKNMLTLRLKPRPWPGPLAQDSAPRADWNVPRSCPWGSTSNTPPESNAPAIFLTYDELGRLLIPPKRFGRLYSRTWPCDTH